MQDVKNRLLKIVKELQEKDEQTMKVGCYFVMDLPSLSFLMEKEKMEELAKQVDKMLYAILLVPAYPEWYHELVKSVVSKVDYKNMYIVDHLTYGAEKDKEYMHPMELPEAYNHAARTAECALAFKMRPLERFAETHGVNTFFWFSNQIKAIIGAGVVTLKGKHVYLAETNKDFIFMKNFPELKPEESFLKHQENICVGCVNGGSQYWRNLATAYPDVFEAMIALETKGSGYLSKRWADWVGLKEFLEGDFLPNHSRGYCPLGRGTCVGHMDTNRSLNKGR